jgi:hypothetical protein
MPKTNFLQQAQPVLEPLRQPASSLLEDQVNKQRFPGSANDRCPKSGYRIAGYRLAGLSNGWHNGFYYYLQGGNCY